MGCAMRIHVSWRRGRGWSLTYLPFASLLPSSNLATPVPHPGRGADQRESWGYAEPPLSSAPWFFWPGLIALEGISDVASMSGESLSTAFMTELENYMYYMYLTKQPVCSQYSLRVMFKSRQTLRTMLTRVNDRLPEEKCSR